MLNSAEHAICSANKSLINNNCKFSFFFFFFFAKIAEHENFSANKYENANIVGIFIFISREMFVLSWVEQEIGPVFLDECETV